MFRRDAVLGNVAVHLLVLLAQGVLLAPFFGHRGFAVELLQAHIPRVGDGFGLRMEPNPRFFEQPKVVASPSVMGEAENPTRRLVDNTLRLQGVTLFLARIIPPLFF